ncbi:MAG: hypothetical protein Tsb0020_32340 [Haliangiales bacterium]
MATHDFSIVSGAFSPTRITATGGDKVRVTNNDNKTVDLTFPSCFEDTSAAVITPGNDVTRQLKSYVTSGVYNLSCPEPADPGTGEDKWDLEGLTGEIEVDPDF